MVTSDIKKIRQSNVLESNCVGTWGEDRMRFGDQRRPLGDVWP